MSQLKKCVLQIFKKNFFKQRKLDTISYLGSIEVKTEGPDEDVILRSRKDDTAFLQL